MPVEIADDGNDAVRAQLGDVLGAAREPVEAHLGREQAGGAQRDVAAADQEYPDHDLATARPSRSMHRRGTPFECHVIAMPHQITIKPSDHSFACDDGETVLAAGDARPT